MGAPAYSVRPLDESTWPAFAALVEQNNGIFGGCDRQIGKHRWVVTKFVPPGSA
jgi:hypothetical protein